MRPLRQLARALAAMMTDVMTLSHLHLLSAFTHDFSPFEGEPPRFRIEPLASFTPYTIARLRLRCRTIRCAIRRFLSCRFLVYLRTYTSFLGFSASSSNVAEELTVPVYASLPLSPS